MLAGVTVVVVVVVAAAAVVVVVVVAAPTRQLLIGWGLWVGVVGAVFPEEALLIAIPWHGCDVALTENTTANCDCYFCCRRLEAYLNTEKWSNDMHRCFVLLRRRTLFRQFDHAAGYAL